MGGEAGARVPNTRSAHTPSDQAFEVKVPAGFLRRSIPSVLAYLLALAVPATLACSCGSIKARVRSCIRNAPRTNPFGQLRSHLFWLLELFGLLPNDCSTLLSFPFAFSDFNCAPFIAVTEAACESLAGWVIFPESSEGIAGTD